MALNLFIDTNIFLSFYHLTSDDLEKLKKVNVLLREERVRLLVPEQVMDEFRRNREFKIADALKGLRNQRLNLQFPQLCKDYEEYSELRRLQREYEEKHKQLLEQITTDSNEETLKADTTIQALFELAARIQIDNRIIENARLRSAVGDPPGKPGSLGDAIIWEALLEEVGSREDLHFVTDDRDYCSALNETDFNLFLMEEWSEKKESEPYGS